MGIQKKANYSRQTYQLPCRFVIDKGNWPILATMISCKLSSHSSRFHQSANFISNLCRRLQITIRISNNARFFPAQFAGPIEKGTNAKELCLKVSFSTVVVTKGVAGETDGSVGDP